MIPPPAPLSDSPKSSPTDEDWDNLSDDEKNGLEGLNLSLWCRERVERVDNRQFSFQNHPFLKTIYKDNSRRRAVMKSTQVGLTTEEILRSFHKTWTGHNWIYWFPTSKLVSRFVQGRYDTLIQNNPKIKDLIRDTDNTGIKSIGKALIYFFGLGAATKDGAKFETLSVPADGETFDEVEKMMPAKVSLALQRMEASPFKYENYISTPGIPNYGMDAIFKESDQKQLNVKCEACNYDNFVEEQVDRFPRCIEQGFLSCDHCGRELNTRKEYEWVPKKENKEISGYHVSKLYFPLADIKGILGRWRKAQSNSRLLEDFYHEDLGLPYVDSQSRLTVEDILKLCGSSPMADEDMGTYLGVDVGGSRKGCHAVVLKPEPTKGWEIVWMGILQMPAGYPDPASWIKAEIKRKMVKFGAKRVGIDFQPETMLARSVVDGLGTKGWMIRYADDQKGSYVWNEEGPKDRMIEVNRTESLDNSQQVLRMSLVLPRRNDVVESFAEHCANVVKVLEEDEITLKKKYVYKHTGDADYRHAFNYACIVAEIDGSTRLTAKPGKVSFNADSFYNPPRKRSGNSIQVGW